jgi:hypothetical protein
MNPRLPSVLFVLSLAGVLVAQETPAPMAPSAPNPKTPQHERLAAFVGAWRTETKMAAMPGVPGMEKETEMVGVEHAGLVCNGLWLQVQGEGTCQGQASSGLWLLGYDPIAKAYQCLAASSMEPAPFCLEGRFDEAKKVWHFVGDTPSGRLRSELVFESADRSVETGFVQGTDGKEVQCMQIVRSRLQGVVAKDALVERAIAKSEKDGKLPKPLAALHADCGTWDAVFQMTMPNAEPMSAKCREVVAPVCGDTWTWSTFTGDLMGGPFEGHALTGYDGKNDKVVSFWIDSANGAWMRTDGSYDAASKTFAMTGTSYDEAGKRQAVSSTATANGVDARTLRMVFGAGDRQHVMTIEYRRALK